MVSCDIQDECTNEPSFVGPEGKLCRSKVLWRMQRLGRSIATVESESKCIVQGLSSSGLWCVDE
jgi:hypothetical protein